MFVYLIHLPIAHLSGALFSYLRYEEVVWWVIPNRFPDGYTPSLLVTYCAWIIIILSMYPLIKWYYPKKQKNRSGWLSYL